MRTYAHEPSETSRSVGVTCWFVRAIWRVYTRAERDGLDRALTSTTSTASTAFGGAKVRTDVAVALGSFVPAAALSGVYSSRVSMAFVVSALIVAPLELSGIAGRLEANHPLRIALPAILGAVAYSEMYAHGSSWPRLSRAYCMALLTFALAGVDVAAIFFHVLGGAWVVPGFTVLVCLAICAIALIPEGKVKWLRS